MAGRRPKDAGLKVLQGNAGKRDSAKAARGKAAAAATPAAGAPEIPKHLSTRAREAWQGLVKHLDKDEMGVLAKVHGMALELLCTAYADFRQAQQVIESKGQTYTTRGITGSKMIRERPEVSISADAWRRVSKMLTEFGITPASGPRVRRLQTKEPDQFELFLVGQSRGRDEKKGGSQ